MLVSWLVSFESKLSIEQVFVRKLIKEETGLLYVVQEEGNGQRNWEISLNCRIQTTTFSHICKTLPKFLLNFFNGLNYPVHSGLWTAGSYTSTPNITKSCTSKLILAVETPSIGGLSFMLGKSLGAWFFRNAGLPSPDASRSMFSFLETLGHYLPPKTWKRLNTP